jgi:hypothetical protein
MTLIDLLAFQSYHQMKYPWWLPALIGVVMVFLIYRGYRRELIRRQQYDNPPDEDESTDS